MENIQVGDKITFITGVEVIITKSEQIKEFINYGTISKIERPKYEVIEEYKEDLLTEVEKDLLKAYIKLIESLNNGSVESIRKEYSLIVIRLKTQLEYQIEVGPRFKNLEDSKLYTLKELEVE